MSVSKSHARALSLILALSVVVGAWLVFEYSNRPSETAVEDAVPSGRVASTDPAKRPVEELKEAPVRSVHVQRDANLMFRCQKNGRASFSDKPCDTDARTMSVTAAEKLPDAPDDRLAQMKRSVVRMEADRLAREREQAVVIVSRATTADSNKTIQCKEVDDWVSSLDARLRQPHDAPTGDYLTGERKKWMDRRFELRC